MRATALPGRVRFPSLAASLRGPHVVCGYAGVLRNLRDPYQPLVRVIFRRVGHDGGFGSFSRPSVALTNLGQLRCGDVVDAGHRVRRYEFAQQSFDVDFSPAGWRFQSAYVLPSFPRGHWLEGLYPAGSIVVFDLPSSRTLWIPSLELFSRCYGASEKVKRVLATYRWSDAEPLLLPAPGRPTTLERPVVKILPPLVNADAWFLASLRHSAYTQRAAKEIYSQLDKPTPSEAASGIFLKVRPWFAGSAQLLVEGEWLTERGAFLAHRIVGASLPPGPAPHIVRERDAPTGATPDPTAIESGPPLSRRHAAPDPVEMTADQPPGRGAGHVELADDAFVVLGPPRPLTVEHVERPRGGRRLSPGDVPAPGMYATGDATGSDAGVGQARIHAPAVRESDGVLLDMWHAFRALAESSSDLNSVEWYTFERGFQSAGPPWLLLFPRPDKSSGNERSWVWLDPPRTPSRGLRGLLVLRCLLDARPGYIAEIQRRTDESGGDTEYFSGLVFTLRDEGELDAWLRWLLRDLRDARGVFASLLDDWPGRAAVFRHPPDGDSTALAEAAARNALAKLRGVLDIRA